MICFSCQKEIPIAPGEIVGRRDECPHCGADSHVCYNCNHYDKNSYNECKEPQAEVVKVKDRSNFCDYFSPGGTKKEKAKDDLLAAAEALFKKK